MFAAHQDQDRIKCLRLLELDSTATEEEIKKGYHKQARKYHPDKNQSPDATAKFQEIQAAYKFLTEGEVFLKETMERHDEFFVNIFRHMFPWMFEASEPRHWGPTYNAQSYYEDEDESEEESSEEELFVPGYGVFPNGHFDPPRRRAYRPDFNDFYGDNENVPPPRERHQNQAGQSFHQSSNHSRQRDRNTSSQRTFYSGSCGPSESGASQHYRQQGNFTTSNLEHGQYFQEMSSKKRRKNQRRANHQDADARRQASAQRPQSQPQTSRSQHGPQSSQSGASSNGQEEAKKDPPPQIRVEKGYKGPGQNQERKPNKKERMQEQKRRERESREIGEELKRKAAEEKEKMERKKKEREEKERIEREKREEEERIKRELQQEKERKEREERQEKERIEREERQEKERIEREKRQEKERIERKKQEAAEKKQQEEKRLQQEREEKAHQARLQRQREQQEIQRKRTEEERKLQAFMDDFDSGLLLDDKGQFKVTDSDVYSIIRRDDLNAIGNASMNRASNVEHINGFKTKDLIELQKAADKAKGSDIGVGKLINSNDKETHDQTSSTDLSPSPQPEQKPEQHQDSSHGGGEPHTIHTQYLGRRPQPQQPQQRSGQNQGQFNSEEQFPSLYSNTRNPGLSQIWNGPAGPGPVPMHQPMNNPRLMQLPGDQLGSVDQSMYGPAPTPIRPLFGNNFPRRGPRRFGNRAC